MGRRQFVLTPGAWTRKAFDALLKAGIVRWARVIEVAGIPQQQPASPVRGAAVRPMIGSRSNAWAGAGRVSFHGLLSSHEEGMQ